MYFCFLPQQANTPSGVAVRLEAAGNGTSRGASNNRASEKVEQARGIVLHAGEPGRLSRSRNIGIKAAPEPWGQQMGNNGAIVSRGGAHFL